MWVGGHYLTSGPLVHCLIHEKNERKYELSRFVGRWIKMGIPCPTQSGILAMSLSAVWIVFAHLHLASFFASQRVLLVYVYGGTL